MKAIVWTERRTTNLQHTKLERYCYTNLFIAEDILL